MINEKFDRNKLNYRQGAVGIVVDDENNFLIIQSLGYKEDEWRFPGGGIDEGEDPQKAVLRELKEELGSNDFLVLATSRFINRYEWPDSVILKKFGEKGKTWRGQEQTHFLVKFFGNKKDIKFQKEELRKILWVKREELPGYFIFPGQWEYIEKVLNELLPGQAKVFNKEEKLKDLKAQLAIYEERLAFKMKTYRGVIHESALSELKHSEVMVLRAMVNDVKREIIVLENK